MNLLQKIKETASSVLPIMVIVLILGLTVAPIDSNLLFRFIVGGLLLIIGLTFFLQGVEMGIQPMGEMAGAALTSKKNLILLLTVAFAIGFLVTLAEPDIQVFGDQIHSVFTNVDKLYMVVLIAAGVGFFLMAGLLRTILNFPVKILLFVLYSILFVLTFFAPSPFIGIAFDSGGATTGPMTVPFIMAIGIGVSSVRSSSKNPKSNDDSSSNFGLTGITSIGPVLAILLYSIILNSKGTLTAGSVASETAAETYGLWVFVHILPDVLMESFSSILPLIFLLIAFQIFLLKLPPIRLARICFGLVWSFIGLSIFLTGVNGGFIEAGYQLGSILGQKACSCGGWWTVLLISSGFAIGSIVVCAEPAVWVLTEQVENLSAGTIKRKIILVFLAFGAAAAIGIALLRAVYGFGLLYVLVPGYLIAMALMLFCPNLFTAIAFDSGGVASGPITSTFVLSFTLGTAQAACHGFDIFGVIALVAMTPLISIQVLGILYNHVQRRQNNCHTK